MSETEDPGLRERPREGRIHDSVPTLCCRATNSSQSSLAVGDKLEQLQPSLEQKPGCGNYGKLCAKNAASFPQLPQPLLLLALYKRKGENKILLLSKTA